MLVKVFVVLDALHGKAYHDPGGKWVIAAEEDVRSARAKAGSAQSSPPAKRIAELPRFNESAAVELPTNSAASQSEAASEETSLPRSTHGGALPK